MKRPWFLGVSLIFRVTRPYLFFPRVKSLYLILLFKHTHMLFSCSWVSCIPTGSWTWWELRGFSIAMAMTTRGNFPNWQNKLFQDGSSMISYILYVPCVQGIFGTFLGTAVVKSPVQFRVHQRRFLQSWAFELKIHHWSVYIYYHGIIYIYIYWIKHPLWILNSIYNPI